MGAVWSGVSQLSGDASRLVSGRDLVGRGEAPIMLGMKWFVALFWLSIVVRAAEPDWPQFRGPDLNPVGLSKALPDRWSKTENVDSGARVVIADRHGRQGLRDDRSDGGQVETASERDHI
jgi:hypothetical protein